MTHEDYVWYLARDICPVCRKRAVAIGLKSCPECLEDNAIRSAAWQQAHPELYKARKQARYKRRREAGLCVNCGNPSGGKSRCPKCAAKENARQKANRVHVVRPSGACYRCDAPAVNGFKLCERHLKISQDTMAKVKPWERGKHKWKQTNESLFLRRRECEA